MPATPTFTIVDNRDGTATVTIAGADGGTTNAIQTMSIDDQWGVAASWTSRGSRTGNGAVTVTIPQGVYFVAVSSTLTGVTVWTPPKPANIASSSRPVVQNAILNAVQARIRLLNLIPSNRVFVHTAVDEQKVKDLKGGAAIVIGPADEMSVLFDDGTLQRDDIGYPTTVAYIAPRNSQTLSESQESAIRDEFFGPTQAIRRAFISQSLDVSGAAVFYCTVRPMRAVERSWWERLVFASGQVLSFRSREPRGIGQ